MVEGYRHAVLLCVALCAAAACSDDPNALIGGRTAQAYWLPPAKRIPLDQQAPSDGTDPADPGASGTSGGSSSTGGTSTAPAGPAGPGQDCVDEINRYRATLGLAPYARMQTSETCADGQAQSDSQTGQAHGAFTKCGEYAQNECPGWPGATDKVIKDCLAMMWAEGPGGGHYENMRKASWRKVSCGLYTAPNGEVTAIQNFR